MQLNRLIITSFYFQSHDLCPAQAHSSKAKSRQRFLEMDKIVGNLCATDAIVRQETVCQHHESELCLNLMRLRTRKAIATDLENVSTARLCRVIGVQMKIGE